MKKTVFLFFYVSVLFSAVWAQSPYEGIVKRNAFDLTAKTFILPPIPTLPLADVYLTGIGRKDKVYTAYMVLKDKTETKFLSLREGEGQHEVKVTKITRDGVSILHKDLPQELTFEQNGFPTIITKAASKSQPKEKGGRSERGRSSDSSKKAVKAPSRPSSPQVVTVPSRRPKIDPKIIEKGLEYLSKTEDSAKREYLLKRLESLQSGQHKTKSDDEWRKSRERGR